MRLIIFLLLSIYCSAVTGSVLSELKTELNPEAQFRIRWLERKESGRDLSGPYLLARGGIFPRLSDYLQTGFELATYQTGGSTTDPHSLPLSNEMETKSIGLSQAFLTGSISHPHSLPILYSFKIGKFLSPLFSSPMLWDANIHPEGLFQAVTWSSTNAFSVSVYATQLSADQINHSSSLRRSWLFEQGVFGFFRWSPESSIKFAVNFYHFHDLSERVADASGTKGNTFIGSLQNNPTFRYEYSPMEAILSLQGQPLGITAEFTAAGAVNFRTPDNERGFFLQASVGDKWKKGKARCDLSYLYAEPDLSVAAFSSSDEGNLNRKGPRIHFSYFPRENLRVGAAFLYSDVLRSSAQQSLRKEAIADMEILF
jgi:hypothetical protein